MRPSGCPCRTPDRSGPAGDRGDQPGSYTTSRDTIMNLRRIWASRQNRPNSLIYRQEFRSLWGPGRRRSASNREPTRTPDSIVTSEGSGGFLGEAFACRPAWTMPRLPGRDEAPPYGRPSASQIAATTPLIVATLIANSVTHGFGAHQSVLQECHTTIRERVHTVSRESHLGGVNPIPPCVMFALE